MTNKQTEKKTCGCGSCSKCETKSSSKMRDVDKGHMEQSLKDESSYLKKTLKK